ncbi:uncharacterized protein NEPG_00710 [Nematocida parisii ERTm1]|uniref:Uncharacterized protein n=1 Tax=Nematocida parisii (strain ERTm3) TaxID=935791 RepID=I3EKK5_NEMP3|nr:uncharacterized protein NEPG_00710 [Nematocida parisii ERTm1]EIJ89752.1 hypothetical protein NEQG_00522 [Nematocida parisii ERTm3]EIJ94045.1 hypothetical protein NEPG_00710 [Nematocida parisii ERTm1]KAI5141224.1 hypothetical protein NEPAR04_0794 [Nematocida parisii]|eukprot:XP_013058541.1 hypothetical protein NEPG_00710 [Nematocida parisii ERTm1]
MSIKRIMQSRTKYSIAVICCLVGSACLGIVSASYVDTNHNERERRQGSDFSYIMNELENNSDIADNIVKSFMEMHKELKNRNELTGQLSRQLNAEGATTINSKYPQPEIRPSQSTSTVESEDEKIIKNSLALLAGNFLRVDNCRVCCTCIQISSGMIGGIKSSSRCCKQFIDEIERILNEHCTPAINGENANTPDGIINRLFNKNNIGGFVVSDIVKRIVDIPATRTMLKTYLIVLLDSILMDMCNRYDCDMCRALYQGNGFMIYRVVRAVSQHTQERESLSLNGGMSMLMRNLGSLEEVHQLLLALNSVFTLVNLNTSAFNIFNNNAFIVRNKTLNETIKPAEVLSKVLQNVLGLSVVLNIANGIGVYCFMQQNGGLIPIPNIYNMSTMVYDAVKTAGVNTTNIIQYIREYTGGNSEVEQGVLHTLQSSGVWLDSTINAQANLELTHQIPITIKIKSDPSSLVNSPKSFSTVQTACKQSGNAQGAYAPVQYSIQSRSNPNPGVYSSCNNTDSYSAFCQKKTKLSGMADHLAKALNNCGTQQELQMPSKPKGILKNGQNTRRVHFQEPPCKSSEQSINYLFTQNGHQVPINNNHLVMSAFAPYHQLEGGRQPPRPAVHSGVTVPVVDSRAHVARSIPTSAPQGSANKQGFRPINKQPVTGGRSKLHAPTPLYPVQNSGSNTYGYH